MTWAIVCLVASTVAEQTGPDVFGVYLTALGIAAIATAHILFPEKMRRLSEGESLRAVLGGGRSRGSR